MSRNSAKFCRILSQVIATSVKSSILIDCGLIFYFPAVVIPSLTGIKNEPNRNEFLTITPAQASLIASMTFLTLPLSSFLSGFITDPLGRKRSMILVNIPIAIAWFILYRTTEIWQVYAAFTIFGVAVGVMEAPIISYISEISEPSTRGTLVAFSNLSITLGGIIVLVLNTFLSWRTVALVCLASPLLSTIALFFVPETPQWLLSKNRTKDAEKSLCWLRGWVPNETVAQEFQELQQHCERSKSCNLCIKQDLKCSHPLLTLREKLSELKRKSTLKPFTILTVLFFFAQFNGIFSMRPYIVQIFKAYDSQIPLDRAAAGLSLSDNIGQIAFLSLVRLTGKRRLYLITGAGIFLSTLVISCYGFIYLPHGYNSFDQQNQTFHLENQNLSYIPMVCLFLWSFFSYSAYLAMPWILVSELYSFKSRGIASGITISGNYVFGFISRKTYYSLETTLSLAGVSLLFCALCGIGLTLMYFILPETEGRSLEDIEIHFADNSKKITDRTIK